MYNIGTTRISVSRLAGSLREGITCKVISDSVLASPSLAFPEVHNRRLFTDKEVQVKK